MMFIFIFLLLLNLLIFFNFEKLSKIINIYDIPDNKLKLLLNLMSYPDTLIQLHYRGKFHFFVCLSDIFFRGFSLNKIKSNKFIRIDIKFTFYF